MMFTKRRDAACQLAQHTLERYGLTRDVYEVCEIERRHDCTLIENHFLVICLASQRCVSCFETVAQSNLVLIQAVKERISHFYFYERLVAAHVEILSRSEQKISINDLLAPPTYCSSRLSRKQRLWQKDGGN